MMGARDPEDQVWQYSLHAEQAVIGAVLMDNAVVDRVADLVGADDFYIGNHQALFRTARVLIDQGKSADLVTVSAALTAAGKGEAALLGYLGELVTSTPSTHNARHYAEVVRERAQRRRLAQAAAAISDACSGPGETRSVIDAAQARILAVADAQAGANSAENGLRSILDTVLSDIDARYQAREVARASGVPYSEVTGTPTGFDALDEKTTGLHGGQLVIVGARPAMGKSSFALKLARNIAMHTRQMALFVSLEMSKRELGLRLLSSEARLHLQRVSTGRIYEPPHSSRNEWAALTSAVGKLADLPLILEERAGLTVMELRSMARRLFREHGGLSCIVVDYLQLMSADRSSDNRAQQVEEISRGLKSLARELQIPVVALSQLNRGLEQRTNKRPMMSDLRDSGAIEQDADVVLFIYRDEVYNPESNDKGLAEIIIGKQRNGPTGMIPLAFRGEYTDFSNLADEQ